MKVTTEKVLVLLIAIHNIIKMDLSILTITLT